MPFAEARLSTGLAVAYGDGSRRDVHPQLSFPNNRSTIRRPRSSPSAVNQIDLAPVYRIADESLFIPRAASRSCDLPMSRFTPYTGLG